MGNTILIKIIKKKVQKIIKETEEIREEQKRLKEEAKTMIEFQRELNSVEGGFD